MPLSSLAWARTALISPSLVSSVIFYREMGLPVYGDPETCRILRKVDHRLIPMLTLLYIVRYLDRGNTGNAKVVGINEYLGQNISSTVWVYLC